MAAKSARQSWLDPSTDAPLINKYTEELSTFIEAMADGKVDAPELAEQEARLLKLMKDVERGGEVVAGFDNEPANCNLFKRSFPRADVYLLDTGNLPDAPPLAEEIRVLADFRI